MLLRRMFWCLLAGGQGSRGGLESELFLGEMSALRVMLFLSYNLRGTGLLFLLREGRGLLVRVR